MAPHTIGALMMQPTGNAQGNYYFFSLSTGCLINWAHATKLPMPVNIIDRVHVVAPGLLFLDCNQALDADAFDNMDSDSNDSDFEPDDEDEDSDDDDDDADNYDDDDDRYDDPCTASDDHGSANDYDNDDTDSKYHPNDDSADDDSYTAYDSDDDGGFPGVNLNPPPMANAGTTGVKTEEEIEEQQQIYANNDDTTEQPKDDNYYPQDFYDKAVDDDDEPPESAGVKYTNLDDDKPPENTGVGPHDDGNDTVEHQAELDQEMTVRYGPHNEWYNMWQCKVHDYSHLFIKTVNDEDEYNNESPLATPQMSMKRGNQMFGEDGVAAVKKEMQQLHDRKVMAPKHGI